MIDAGGSPSTYNYPSQIMSLAQEIEKINQNDKCLKNIPICRISMNDLFLIPLKHTHRNIHKERERTE